MRLCFLLLTCAFVIFSCTDDSCTDNYPDLDAFIPVRRYLEKVLSLSRSGYALFLAAHSRKLKPFLSKSLKIVSIPPQVDREYSADFYQPAFRKFCEDQSDVMRKIEGDMRQQKIPTQFSELPDNLRDMVLDEEWKNRMVTPLVAALQKEKNSAIKLDECGLSGRARVHCECLLVAHFVKNRASLRPYDYIGLSKLLCFGCHSYFRAYNITHSTMSFFARGTHGKIYIPWVPPTLEDGSEDNVRVSMCKSMLEDLDVVWSASQQRMSDSTDASGSGNMIRRPKGWDTAEAYIGEQFVCISSMAHLTTEFSVQTDSNHCHREPLACLLDMRMQYSPSMNVHYRLSNTVISRFPQPHPFWPRC